MSIDLEEGQWQPFKVLKSETVPLTKELVSKMRSMRASPVERDLVSRRVDFLRDRYNAGLFHAPHWVVAVINGEEVRVNGQHSSEMLSKLNGEFREGMSVHMDYYECSDMDGQIALFRQFDDRRSARSEGDVAGAFQGSEEALSELPRKIGKLGVEGVVWHKDKVQTESVPTGDDRYDFFHDKAIHPFLLWLGEILADNRGPELRSSPVAAAMYAAHRLSPEAATEFWGDVVTGGREFEENHPTTVLHDWLERRRKGEFHLRPITQLYQGCIYAWNAFRDGRDTISGIKCDIRKKLTQAK